MVSENFALTLHVQDCFSLDSGLHLFHAGHTGIHVRVPVRVQHAGDDAGGAPGHHHGEGVRPSTTRRGRTCARSAPASWSRGLRAPPAACACTASAGRCRTIRRWRGRCSTTTAAGTASASCLSTGLLVLRFVDAGRFKRDRTR